MNIGLKQRILMASSEEEINKLMDEGKTFKLASETTIRRWGLAKEKALKTLADNHKKSENTESKTIKEEPTKKTVKRKVTKKSVIKN